MIKSSALKRETDCMIIFNIGNNKTEKETEIEMSDLARLRENREIQQMERAEMEERERIIDEEKRRQGIYSLPGSIQKHAEPDEFNHYISKFKRRFSDSISKFGRQLNPKIDSSETKEFRQGYKSELEKSEHSKSKFIIKDRKTKSSEDIFDIVSNYASETEFCQLGSSYVRSSVNTCDFIVFINDKHSVTEKQQYVPLCIATINIYKNEVTQKNILFIDIFCSDAKYGQCGTYLMNTIKYIASLLNCSEIRLVSVYNRNTLEFYKRNGFYDIYSSPERYNHYYIMTPDDSMYKRLNSIEGTAILGDIREEDMYTGVEGGNSKKRFRKTKHKRKRNRNLTKHKRKRNRNLTKDKRKYL